MSKQTKTERRLAIIELARAEYEREGEVEIDDNAKLSEGEDNGSYVAAWVWVSFFETPYDKDMDTHLMTDQPPECPECGKRVECILGIGTSTQVVRCPNCKHQYNLVAR